MTQKIEVVCGRCGGNGRSLERSDWSCTVCEGAGEREKIREKDATIRDLLAALLHMKGCGACAEDSWETCEGGRDALAAIAKAETFTKR